MSEFKYDSRRVTSNQNGPHENIGKVINKHLNSKYRKPIQQHNQEAFEHILATIKSTSADDIIIDSCCGTGASSIFLAENNPNKLIIGIDQSYKRLNKQYDDQQIPSNCLLVRANCEDIWRLCIAHQLPISRHYILYPNPWPKSDHLKRRWHGHPVFKCLPELSPYTELRSNWLLYLEEFAIAWHIATSKDYQPIPLKVDQPITLFEKKYHESGQELYQLVID